MDYAPNYASAVLTDLRAHFHTDPDSSRDMDWPNLAMTVNAPSVDGLPDAADHDHRPEFLRYGPALRHGILLHCLCL